MCCRLEMWPRALAVVWVVKVGARLTFITIIVSEEMAPLMLLLHQMAGRRNVDYYTSERERERERFVMVHVRT